MHEPGGATTPGCPQCGHANREGSRFYGECGARIETIVACPSCGSESPAALLDEAVKIAQDLGARGQLAQLGVTRGRLYERLGDQSARSSVLADALKLAEEIDARGLIQQIRAEADSAVTAGD